MKRLLLFIVAVGLIAGLMRLAGWFPLLLSREPVRNYPSIEGAQRTLGIERVFLPSYFPASIDWPAREVIGGSGPGRILVIHFTHRDTEEIVLGIRQRELTAQDLPLRIEPVRVTATSDVSLKGVPVRLETGFCADKNPCNAMIWRRGTEEITLVFRGAVSELGKIAESMIHD